MIIFLDIYLRLIFAVNQVLLLHLVTNFQSLIMVSYIVLILLKNLYFLIDLILRLITLILCSIDAWLKLIDLVKACASINTITILTEKTL